jgi:beta-lactamase regulating signal transducer with metallopeptidase domain
VTIGGAIGFAVLATVLVTTSSLVATAVFALARKQLRAAGPAREKNAAAWALIAPLAVSAVVVTLIALRGSGAVDHCEGHAHHAHFCLVHGAAWLARPWAVAIAVVATVTLLLRSATVAWRRIVAARAIAQVRRVAAARDGVRIALSDRVFCFVAGLRHPEVYVSSCTWNALADDERLAVVAHEREHARHGDLWMAAIVDVAASLAAPLAGAWLRDRWTDASERLCDAAAADATSPESVARALVNVCRAGSLLPMASGFPASASAVENRVRAVLAGSSPGRKLGWRAWAMLATTLVAVCIFATELHHVLETLLG